MVEMVEKVENGGNSQEMDAVAMGDEDEKKMKSFMDCRSQWKATGITIGFVSQDDGVSERVAKWS